MTDESKRWLSIIPLFNPEDGIKIYDPPGNGSGYWIGAPSVIYDNEKGKFYLYYRRRKPRELGRGYECGISESTDGINFKEIWTASKDKFGSISVERAGLVKTQDGKYRLYIGYVAPEDNKWKIDMIEADSPENFNPDTKRLVLAPENCGVEGVKDPYIMIIGGLYYMLVSYAPTPSIGSDNSLHATADVFNTGKTSSNTGLAISGDGINWQWLGDVMSPPKSGWNAYATRATCVVYMPPVFCVFYDGGADVNENYEEKTGLAVTFDLKNYHHVSVQSPILVSPYSSGSLRYMDAIKLDGKIYYYYEYARLDGAHELRMNKVSER
ncbi:TPA: hypothetical protein ENX78_03145 [Candidatus Poribacteria bacterium]|nr:hypothetical protein [Candidatus Poribacteria bacterium]